MKLPSSFKLNGRLWRVNQDAQLEPNLDGLCHPFKNEIYIGGHLKGDALLDTFIHEVLHACFPARSKRWSWEEEEAIVRMLAPRLLRVMKQFGWVR